MPTYDYRCEDTGAVFEVNHSMSTVLTNWAELCEAAGIEPGEVPMDSTVTRLATGGQVVKSSSLSNPEPPCASGPCCGGGACGF